jgi:hypothetical protein
MIPYAQRNELSRYGRQLQREQRQAARRSQRRIWMERLIAVMSKARVSFAIGVSCATVAAAMLLMQAWDATDRERAAKEAAISERDQLAAMYLNEARQNITLTLKGRPQEVQQLAAQAGVAIRKDQQR